MENISNAEALMHFSHEVMLKTNDVNGRYNESLLKIESEQASTTIESLIARLENENDKLQLLNFLKSYNDIVSDNIENFQELLELNKWNTEKISSFMEEYKQQLNSNGENEERSINDIRNSLFDDETQRSLDRLEKSQEDGVRDILKYFDRIHDNIFTYNNILIAAFFALAQFQNDISRWTILIPLINLWFLIWIDYRMMEKSRFEADIMSKTQKQIDDWGKKITSTNFLSLLSIFTTLGVTLAFLYYLLK